MKEKNWETALKKSIMYAVNTSSSVDGKALNPKVKVYIENNILDIFRIFMKENYPENKQIQVTEQIEQVEQTEVEQIKLL